MCSVTLIAPALGSGADDQLARWSWLDELGGQPEAGHQQRQHGQADLEEVAPGSDPDLEAGFFHGDCKRPRRKSASSLSAAALCARPRCLV